MGCDFPSLYQTWCNNVGRRRNYGPKSKSKMAAVRHLGFATSSYRTTHEVLSLGHIGLSNFMLIRCIVLKIWRFEFVCIFGLKCLFTPQNFGFFCVWTPKRDWSHRSLAGTALTDPSTGATWARDEEIKKRKKVRKETYSDKLDVRPDHTRWGSDICSCMPYGLREVVLSFNFRQNQNQLNGFRDAGSKFAISYT